MGRHPWTQRVESWGTVRIEHSQAELVIVQGILVLFTAF